MRALRFAVWIVAWIGAAQSASAQTILTPDSRLSQGAACFSLRCFPTLYGLDENAAVTGNTGPGIAVQTPSGADVWNVEQTLTNPDYNNLPTPNYPWQQFGPAAYRGQALLIGGTSPRYNYKDVVYVYARVGGVWTHLQMLALQRPAGYDRTYIHRIATDGVTAVISGVRVKDAIDDEAFAQVDLGPGESRPVTLTLRADDLAYWDVATSAWVLEPIEYEVIVAHDAADAGVRATVRGE